MCIINNINSLLKSFEYKIKKHEKNFRNNLNGYHNNDIFLTDSVKKYKSKFQNSADNTFKCFNCKKIPVSKYCIKVNNIIPYFSILLIL